MGNVAHGCCFDPDQSWAIPNAQSSPALTVKAAVGDGFDVAVSERFLDREKAESGIGHASGFYYHRLMNDLVDMPKLQDLASKRNLTSGRYLLMSPRGAPTAATAAHLSGPRARPLLGPGAFNSDLFVTPT